jgi:hypothetical protein
VPFEGTLHGVQLDPQLSTLSSGRQSVPHLWNPAAHAKTHLLATQAASVPGGALAVQSTQTFTPQSSGVLVQGPSVGGGGPMGGGSMGTFASDVVRPSAGGSFAPLPHATDASTAAIAISFAMEVSSPSRRIRTTRRS